MMTVIKLIYDMLGQVRDWLIALRHHP